MTPEDNKRHGLALFISSTNDVRRLAGKPKHVKTQEAVIAFDDGVTPFTVLKALDSAKSGNYGVSGPRSGQ